MGLLDMLGGLIRRATPESTNPIIDVLVPMLTRKGAFDPREVSRPRVHVVAAVVASIVVAGACSGGSSGVQTGTTEVDSGVVLAESPAFVNDVFAAVDAVEIELGGPQQYFEVTANAQVARVFVAVDDASAVVAYIFADGELLAPAPKQQGASGETFAADDIDFDPDQVVSVAQTQLPESTVDSVSVVGNAAGATYVLSATSPGGGFLDIVVGPDGQVFSVDPV
jgi:hypothetical protein